MTDSFLMMTGWIVFGFAAVAAIPAVVALRLKRLPPSGAAASLPSEWLADSDRPLVSVIVPARNEQQQIGKALRSLLASESIPLEIIAVNDRSEDSTGQIMDEVAGEDARLRVVHLTELPAGWLGKSHAMHRA